MDLLTGEFIKKNARIEDYDLGKIIYDLIMDDFTGYVRISTADDGFVDKYLLIENGKIIGSSEESSDSTINGWDACKNFLRCKKGWFDICALQPHEMSLVKKWNKDSLFTLMEDMISIITELEEGKGTIIDTWGDGVLAMDSKGRPYLLLDWDRDDRAASDDTPQDDEVQQEETPEEEFRIKIDIGESRCFVGDVISFLIQVECEDGGEIFDLDIKISIDGEEQKSFIRMIEVGKFQEIEFVPEKPGEGEILVIASPIGSENKHEYRERFKIEEMREDESPEIVDVFQDLKLDLDIDSLKDVIESEGLGHMLLDSPDSDAPGVEEEISRSQDNTEEEDHERLGGLISREIQIFGKKNRIKILNTSVVINEAINVYVWYEFGLLSKLKHLNDAELAALLEREITEELDSNGIKITLPLNVVMNMGVKGKKKRFEDKLADAFDF